MSQISKEIEIEIINTTKKLSTAQKEKSIVFEMVTALKRELTNREGILKSVTDQVKDFSDHLEFLKKSLDELNDSRVEEGLVNMADFNEGEGNVINDIVNDQDLTIGNN